MEALQYLLNLNTTYVLIGLFTVFFTLEQFVNKPFRLKERINHSIQNALLQGTFIVLNLFWSTLIVLAIESLNRNEIGLLHRIELPFWIELVVGVMLYDLTAYWFHRMAHTIPVLWRLHRVLHSDNAMDSSTSFRSHPIEIMVVFGASDILATALFGPSSMALGLYALLLIPFFVLQHTTLRFPAWLDKTIGLVITTPNLHKIHHEQDQFHTDSNYADIFILWDRLFGTFTYKPADQLNIGLKEFNKPEQHSFWYLMRSPFLSIERRKTED